MPIEVVPLGAGIQSEYIKCYTDANTVMHRTGRWKKLHPCHHWW